MGIKFEDAVGAQKRIEQAADELNRCIQAASLQGLIVSLDTMPFRHAGGQIFEVIQVEVKVKPGDLEV